MREGLRYVLSVRDLWLSFAMFAIVGTFSFNFRVALPLLVTRALHGTDVGFTALYTITSLGAVVGALLVARRRFVELRHVLGAALALGVAMLVLAAMPNVYLAAPAVFLVGGSSIVFMTATTSLAQVDTPRDMIGRVLALQTALIGGTALARGAHRRPARRPRRRPSPRRGRRSRLPRRFPGGAFGAGEAVKLAGSRVIARADGRGAAWRQSGPRAPRP